MGFRMGIVGLPNVGKSTLFNALTKTAAAQAAIVPAPATQPAGQPVRAAHSPSALAGVLLLALPGLPALPAGSQLAGGPPPPDVRQSGNLLAECG